MEQTRTPERELAAVIFDMEEDVRLVRDLAAVVRMLGASADMIDGEAVAALGKALGDTAGSVVKQWEQAFALIRPKAPQQEKPLSPDQPF